MFTSNFSHHKVRLQLLQFDTSVFVQSSKPACYKIDWKAFKAIGLENAKLLNKRNLIFGGVKYKKLQILHVLPEWVCKNIQVLK